MVMQTGKVNALLQVLNTAQPEWEFSFPTGPPLIPSWLEGQKGLITAGWWWKSWSLWGFVWQHPIPIRKGKALPVLGRDGSPGFLCGPPPGGGGGDNVYHCVSPGGDENTSSLLILLWFHLSRCWDALVHPSWGLKSGFPTRTFLAWVGVGPQFFLWFLAGVEHFR